MIAWAEAHGVSERLDDVLVGGDGPDGTYLPGRNGEALTYREILLARIERGRAHDAAETARRYLHRLAELATAHRAERAWMEEHGREPEDETLAAFLERLRRELREVQEVIERIGVAARAVGTYERVRVLPAPTPAPRLLYEEATLTGPRADGDDVSLFLLGWSEGDLRWGRQRGNRAVPGDVAPELLRRALEAMIDFVRDPRAALGHEALLQLLLLPAWRYALSTLDESLARLDAATPPAEAALEERLAFA